MHRNATQLGQSKTRSATIIIATFSVAAALLLTACTIPSSERASGQTSVTTSVTTPATTLTTAPPINIYQCDSGETISATYSTPDAAIVQYQNKTYHLQIAISASGARYIGHDLEWWTKGIGPGSEGMLMRHLANGTSGGIIERCRRL